MKINKILFCMLFSIFSLQFSSYISAMDKKEKGKVKPLSMALLIKKDIEELTDNKEIIKIIKALSEEGEEGQDNLTFKQKISNFLNSKKIKTELLAILKMSTYEPYLDIIKTIMHIRNSICYLATKQPKKAWIEIKKISEGIPPMKAGANLNILILHCLIFAQVIIPMSLLVIKYIAQNPGFQCDIKEFKTIKSFFKLGLNTIKNFIIDVKNGYKLEIFDFDFESTDLNLETDFFEATQELNSTTCTVINI